MDVNLFKKTRKTPGLVIKAKNHTVTVGMLLFFIIGCIIGALLIRFNNPISTLLVSTFKKYNGLVTSNGFIRNFLDLLISNFLIIIVIFLLGLSAVGSPLVCIISVVKGAGIGIVSSFIYKTYLLRGFGYCMLVFYPQQIINMLALFIVMNESYINSKQIFKTITTSLQYEFHIKIYIFRFIFAMCIQTFSCFFGALLNTYLSSVFIK